MASCEEKKNGKNDSVPHEKTNQEQFSEIRCEIRQSRRRVEQELESCMRLVRQETDRRIAMRQGRTE